MVSNHKVKAGDGCAGRCSRIGARTASGWDGSPATIEPAIERDHSVNYSN